MHFSSHFACRESKESEGRSLREDKVRFRSLTSNSEAEVEKNDSKSEGQALIEGDVYCTMGGREVSSVCKESSTVIFPLIS
jgi:hypothetical protein